MESGFAGQEYQNVDSLIAILIYNHLATLHELKTVYTLEDAMIMYESWAIPKYNEYMANKQALKKVRK